MITLYLVHPSSARWQVRREDEECGSSHAWSLGHPREHPTGSLGCVVVLIWRYFHQADDYPWRIFSCPILERGMMGRPIFDCSSRSLRHPSTVSTQSMYCNCTEYSIQVSQYPSPDHGSVALPVLKKKQNKYNQGKIASKSTEC